MSDVVFVHRELDFWDMAKMICLFDSTDLLSWFEDPLSLYILQ